MTFHENVISIGLNDAWFVVRSCEGGVFGWKAACRVNAGNRLVNLKVATGKPKWKCLHITDLQGWMVYDLDALPPCSCFTKGPTGETLGIVLRIRGEPMPLLRNGALHAFQGMTCAFMTKLLKFLEIEVVPLPTLESDIVMLLEKNCLPEKTEAELLDIASQRHLMKIKFNTQLTPEVVTQSADILGDSTTKEMTTELMNYVKKIAAQKNLLPKPKGEPKKNVKQKVLAAKDFDSWEAAQKYKPNVPNCVLSMETEWHARWKITYPRDLPPYSCQAAFDPKDPASKRTALYVVLRWCWQEHLAMNPKETCPWNLDP